MKWTIQSMEAMDTQTLYEIIALRIKVFIIEQACLYEELDYKDFKSIHVYGKDKSGKIVAYLRILAPGVTFDEVAIGRVVVHPEVRKFGIGRELMQVGLQAVCDLYGDVPVRISAQAYLEKFYASLGFVPQTEIYLEDDIPHLEMLLNRVNY